MESKLPNSGPLPQPRSLAEARAVLQQERFPAPKVDFIKFVATEFTSICPRTGQPDFGTVTVLYIPSHYCMESKALKFYLWAYRNEGAFCEELAASIADDVFRAIEPTWVKITVVQNTRGGIALEVTAERGGEKYGEGN